MGSKGGSQPKESSQEKYLTEMAQRLFEFTSPFRGEFYKQWTPFQKGGYKVEEMPMYQPLYQSARSGIEGQYNVAKENILSNVFPGGAQTRELSNLESSRAEQVSSLPAMIGKDLIQDTMNKIYGAAFQVPGVAMQGVGTAASTYGAKQAAQMQSQAAESGAKWQGLGKLTGAALSSGLSGLKSPSTISLPGVAPGLEGILG